MRRSASVYADDPAGLGIDDVVGAAAIRPRPAHPVDPAAIGVGLEARVQLAAGRAAADLVDHPAQRGQPSLADTPAGLVSDVEVNSSYDDAGALRAFAGSVAAVTFEFENNLQFKFVQMLGLELS